MRVILNQRVRAITANTVFLKDGSRIESSSVISTVGNGPHPLALDLIDKLGLPNERGRIRTLPNLRSEGCEWLWTAGDCAAVPFWGRAGEFCPPTAQFAQRQGALMGRNLLARRAGAQPRPFKFTGLGELAVIGHFQAIAMIGGLKFHGVLAWWMWRTIYIAKLPGLALKLRVLTDWTFDVFFAKDLNLINPRFSRPLRDMHLEPGDVLFNPGEPAFSLYFVKEGIIEIRDGERVVKAIHGGDYFGERALLEDRIWRYSAVAKTQVAMIALGAEEFLAITEGSSTLKRLFTRSAQAYATNADLHALMDQLAPGTLESPASDLMNESVDTLRLDTRLVDALALFKSKHHGSYPVVDAGGKLLGTVKRDALYDTIKVGELDGSTTVADLPLEHLPTLRPEVRGREILETLLRSGRNKLLVTDTGDKLLGVLTVVDLMEDSLRRNPPKVRSGA
jgi:NADH dehydrogenase